jgi:hypothetical protein
LADVGFEVPARQDVLDASMVRSLRRANTWLAQHLAGKMISRQSSY